MSVLTWKASYIRGGLWEDLSRNFCVFTSSKLAIDQQKDLVAWDGHLDLVALTITKRRRRAGSNNITHRNQKSLKTTRRSVWAWKNKVCANAKMHSRLSTRLCWGCSQTERWRAALHPGKRVQTGPRWQKRAAGSPGRSGSLVLKKMIRDVTGSVQF